VYLRLHQPRHARKSAVPTVSACCALLQPPKTPGKRLLRPPVFEAPATRNRNSPQQPATAPQQSWNPIKQGVATARNKSSNATWQSETPATAPLRGCVGFRALPLQSQFRPSIGTAERDRNLPLRAKTNCEIKLPTRSRLDATEPPDAPSLPAGPIVDRELGDDSAAWPVTDAERRVPWPTNTAHNREHSGNCNAVLPAVVDLSASPSRRRCIFATYRFAYATRPSDPAIPLVRPSQDRSFFGPIPCRSFSRTFRELRPQILIQPLDPANSWLCNTSLLRDAGLAAIVPGCRAGPVDDEVVSDTTPILFAGSGVAK
jgi:hypothetical protein